MNKMEIGLMIMAVVSLLCRPRRLRQSRRHGLGYLVGVMIVTAAIFLLMRHISGYYMNALGTDG